MIKKIFFPIVFMLNLFFSIVQAQNITGTIRDENDGTMPGATVQIKGTTKGFMTGIDGKYSIAAQKGDILIYSYVGYTTQEITVGTSIVIDVKLAIEAKKLDEVIVVGYGVQKKSLVTGAIAKIKGDDINSLPTQRLEQALQGRASGLVLNQTSGSPGAPVTVRIRGVSSNGNADPLFIIDGMKTSKYVMNEISPSDISSVEVLKDAASCAIYGSEGANGVIIITTKSGNKNNKTIVQYDMYYGVQVAKPVKVMNADQYRDYFREAYAYDKRIESSDMFTSLQLPSTAGNIWGSTDSLQFFYNTPEYQYNVIKAEGPKVIDQALINQKALYDAGTISKFVYNQNVNTLNKKKAEINALTAPLTFAQEKAIALDKDKGIFGKAIDTTGSGTNWMDQIFRPAMIQNHHLSVQTSSEKTNFYLAASYYTQDGVVAGADNNFTRYNFRVNGDVQAKKWLKLGTNITGAHSDEKRLDINNSLGGVVVSAMSYDPTMNKLYWDSPAEFLPYFNGRKDSMVRTRDGERWLAISEITEGERFNPMAKIELNKNNQNSTDRLLSSFYTEIKPFTGFVFRASINTEFTLTSNQNWGTPWYMTEANNLRSWASVNLGRYLKNSFDYTLTYGKAIGHHDFSVLLGQSYENYNYYTSYAGRDGLFLYNNEFGYVDAVPLTEESKKLQNTGGSKYKETQLSFFGRFNYNYREKYLLTAILRRDGSSRFAPGYQVGYFPSFSVGWNLNKEKFFHIPSVSMLKIRGSWGENGSLNNVSQFQWISTQTTGTLGGQTVVVSGVTKNPSLTWETSRQINVGFDVGFLNNKLIITTDYYRKSTIDLLAIPYLPAWSTEAVAWHNVGEIRNSGFELDLGYSQQEKEFKYDAKLTASYLKNIVVDFKASQLKGYESEGSNGPHTRFLEGQPVWYFQGYKAIGIFQSWEEIRNYTYTDPSTGMNKLIQPDAQPGDPKIQDIGGAYDEVGNPIPDGSISASDYTYLGKPMPTVTLGMSFNCEYKSFDFSAFLYSELGKTIYNATLRDRWMYNREARYYTDRWTEENNTNSWMRATKSNNGAASNLLNNSLFFEDGSYLRLKNLTIGYTIPQKLTQKALMSKLRVYFTIANLFTITKYSGSDPEIGQVTNSNSYGVDLGMYPSAKQFIGGINVTF